MAHETKNVNENIELARRFHAGTKHPGGSLMSPYHRYSAAIEPRKEKRYLDLPAESVHVNPNLCQLPALQAIRGSLIGKADRAAAEQPDRDQLVQILHYSAGITKHIAYPGWGKIAFRAAACTGALYHVEVYLVCNELPDLQAGVYHFNPVQNALTMLRSGDFRGELFSASGFNPAVEQAPAVLVYTDVPIRNAIKYQARAYRHAFWDSGTILANSFAVSTACGLPANLVLGFVDDQVNHLLGIDGKNEYALALLPIGTAAPPPVTTAPIPELAYAVEAVTPYPVDLSAIQTMQAASQLPDSQSVARWRQTALTATPHPPSENRKFISLPNSEFPSDSIQSVITRRGSTRQFSHQPISLDQLSLVLKLAMQPIPSDFENPEDQPISQAYLIVNAVDALPSGSYVYHPSVHALEQLMRAELRNTARFLALGQDLGGDASVNIYFLADLEPLLERFGNRGYRAAMMDASLRAGRVYLAAYALGFGASGLTFYDDEVTKFFSPHGRGKSVLFLITLGHRAHQSA
jgi:SagB-type dehydrogenase family enzyme